MQELIKINSELNIKYNSFDHLDKLKCIENVKIVQIEEKIENASIIPNYDYTKNLVNEIISLPEINIDFLKLTKFQNEQKDLVEDLCKEIFEVNSFIEAITKYVDMSKVESLKERSIINYLFYFLSRFFLYIITHKNFMISKPNTKTFLKFFYNYNKIITCTKMYIEEDRKNNSMIIEDNNNLEDIIKKEVNEDVCKCFSELKNYPIEFKDAIMKCHNFITMSIYSFAENVPSVENDEDMEIKMDKDMIDLFTQFIISFSLLHDINEQYSIVDYTIFINDCISRDLDKRMDFNIYLRNQEIKKKKNKQLKIDKGIDDESEEIEIKEGDDIEFTLFDYIWLYNTSAKNDIIRLFNLRQQHSIFRKLSRQRNIDNLLNDLLRNGYKLKLNIRRERLIEDTLNEISKPNINLQNEVQVKFQGEQGVDQGGVRKEFFMLFIRQIFDPNYGMFSYNSKVRLYWFNHYSFEAKIKYELIGTIFGLAIYNSIILDVKLPIAIYKKLLGVKPDLEDMKECDPDLYNSFIALKNNNSPNLKEELDTTFTVIDDKFGEKITIPLIKDGEKIMIDSNNKNEYIELYLDWYFNKSINDYYTSFEKGFYRVFDKNLSEILRPEELELIICGTQFLDFHELKRVCRYEEYDKDSETIKLFWEIALDFNENEKRKFLSFVTGCDRAPIDGLGSLIITISNGGTDINQLPSAHTCFDNLILPDYKDKERMKKSLLTAINYSEGFGLI